MKDEVVAKEYRVRGDKYYTQFDFDKALVCYNRSLCYSKGSEQLGLTYAARATVYLAQGLYDNCMNNIALARYYKYHRVDILNDQTERCKDHKSPIISGSIRAKRSMVLPRRDKAPFMAACLEYGPNQCVTSNCVLKTGDVIAIEHLMARTVLAEGRYRRCLECLTSNNLDLLPCDCTTVMFCSTTCWTNARHHTFNCKMSCNFYAQARDFPTAPIMRSFAETQEAIFVDTTFNGTTIFDLDLRIEDKYADYRYIQTVSPSPLQAAKNLRALCLTTYVPAPEFMEYNRDIPGTLLFAEKATRIHEIRMLNSDFIGKECSGFLRLGSLYRRRSIYTNINLEIEDNVVVHIASKTIARGEELIRSHDLTA